MTSLRGQERREFPQSVRKIAFRRACKPDGVPKCECPTHIGPRMIRAGHLRYEHLQPDGLAGEPTIENCGVWCDVCSLAKDKTDKATMSKADRVVKKTFGLMPTKRQKIASRGFRKAPPQHSATRPIERRSP